MYLILTTSNANTFTQLDDFFSTQSVFCEDKQQGGDFYFKVSDQEDADATEKAIEDEISGNVNDSEELSFSFELED